ncbi:MAG: ATP-binding cassette domain-containing protein [Bacilli bacterium]
MIELKNYSKSFGTNQIFSNQNICFNDNLFIGFYGPSGCGKSTLLNSISMLDFNYEGQIIVNGQNISDMKAKKREEFRRDNFAYVFSEANLLSYLSAEENVLLPLTFLKRKKPADYDHLTELLNLGNLMDHNVNTLSEGEKQRFSVLRALITGQPFVVCDEPTAHLDHDNSLLLVKKLKEIANNEHRMIMMSCHDDSLLSYFDIVYGINNKELYEKK